MNQLSEHEYLLVKRFVISERRQRWLEMLSNSKRRESFLVRLADPRDFIEEFMHPIPPKLHSVELLTSALVKSGAPSECYIVSQFAGFDGRTMPLNRALDAVLGIGLGSVLSCVPGHLLYYEEETPGKRWLLKSA